MEFLVQNLWPNVTLKTSRSGGKGGQHVNKVSSKVALDYDFESSALFTDVEKERIRQKLENRINSDGCIHLVCEEDRSQHVNKERAFMKLLTLLKGALHERKPRKVTKPSKSVVEQRLTNKHRQALKKLNRNRKDYNF